MLSEHGAQTTTSAVLHTDSWILGSFYLFILFIFKAGGEKML